MHAGTMHSNDRALLAVDGGLEQLGPDNWLESWQRGKLIGAQLVGFGCVSGGQSRDEVQGGICIDSFNGCLADVSPVAHPRYFGCPRRGAADSA